MAISRTYTTISFYEGEKMPSFGSCVSVNRTFSNFGKLDSIPCSKMIVLGLMRLRVIDSRQRCG